MKVRPVASVAHLPRHVFALRASIPVRPGRLPRRHRGRFICRADEGKGQDLYDLQAKLDAAVASEDYRAAAKLRDAISDRLLDVQVAVELANRRFYAAFQSASHAEMLHMWSRGPHVQCIHPGQRAIGGYERVMQSWEVIFRTIPRGDFRIELEDVCIHVIDRTAIVHCLERISAGRDDGCIQATNVFEYANGKWMMIMHHGSPAM